MTTVRLNASNIDIVELKLETVGTNFCHFTARDNILSSDLQYIFGVTNLNVDCSGLSIFPPATDDFLIRIKKRVIGSTIGILPLANTATNTFSIIPAGRKYYDVSTFLTALSEFANTFSRQLDLQGILAAEHGGGNNIPAGAQAAEGVPYLKIGIDASARLQITGIAQFWNHFVIELSNYGAVLFQLESIVVNNVIAVTRDVVTGVYSTSIAVVMAGAVATYPMVAGNSLTVSEIHGSRSILRFLDHRLYLTVETHLSIKYNMKVKNGKEKTDMSIVRVPFLNEAESTVYSRNGEMVEDVRLTTKTYSGRVSFIDKTEEIRQWNQLMTSYEQKMFRFQLFCVYNVFSNGVFDQVKKDVQFEKDGSWDLTLRFVNKI